MTGRNDDNALLLEIRQLVMQQFSLERERMLLDEAILVLLQKMADVSAGDSDDPLLTAIAKMDAGVARLTAAFTELADAISAGS